MLIGYWQKTLLLLLPIQSNSYASRSFCLSTKLAKCSVAKKKERKEKKNRMVEAAGTDPRFVFERLPAKTEEVATPCDSTGVLYSISSTTFLAPLQTSNVAGMAVAFQGALSLEHGKKRENATVGEITRA